MYYYATLAVILCRYQDDGEMYDEFGNLKKKFRVKTSQQAETGRALPGAGRAGWEVEEIGIYAILGHYYS